MDWNFWKCEPKEIFPPWRKFPFPRRKTNRTDFQLSVPVAPTVNVLTISQEAEHLFSCLKVAWGQYSSVWDLKPSEPILNHERQETEIYTLALWSTKRSNLRSFYMFLRESPEGLNFSHLQEAPILHILDGFSSLSISLSLPFLFCFLRFPPQ
jgi:hypothetical protein